ncbi:MAG TPA: HEAT repeat domain-containing protein [Tepidisphaeraceae bacterium]|jgi:hypothetical protein|nr:HEAT repeat domain-containing protein [Tepidisphaeraceae bacterium]
MNRLALCVLPLLLLTAGCFSSIDDEDYKPFTTGRWREMIRENEYRLKPEEQRPSKALTNPIRLFIGVIAEGISRIHDLATGHNFFQEARKLVDSSPDHRRSGIIYLSDQSPGRRDPYLKQYMNMARTDLDPSVRAMAIRALNRARDKRAIPIFLAALEEKNDAIRLEAAKGLANIPDPSAASPLIRHLDSPDENVDVRIACADALRLYRTSEVAQALVRAMRERNFGVSWQARKSLQLMTGQDFRYDTAAWLTFLSGTAKPFG